MAFHDVGQLLEKPRIGRQLERVDPVGLQPLRVPGALDRGRTHALACAMVRVLQCVAADGVVRNVASTICWTFVRGGVGLRPRPGASSVRAARVGNFRKSFG